MRAKVLFICKERSAGSYNEGSFGLHNSARFIAAFLNRNGIKAKVVSVTDNNSIDREVTLFQPTHVFIHALWVVPTKFPILFRLHPNVKWNVRIHSKTPFLAMEGIAMEWIADYIDLMNMYPGRFTLSVNSTEMYDDLQSAFRVTGDHIVTLPNIYDIKNLDKSIVKNQWKGNNPNFIEIGCFGAIRPLKNQLKQAIAAIGFADRIGKTLLFHINSTRQEQRGEAVLKNLRNLFRANQRHHLVEHHWMDHAEFMKVVYRMDIGMQVSFTESFNIIAADFVASQVPVVVSTDITWMPWITQADPNSTISMQNRLYLAYKCARLLTKISNRALDKYNILSETIWLNYLM